MEAFFFGFMGGMVGWAVYEWVAFAFCVLLLIPFVEYEQGPHITITLLVMAVLLYFATDGHILTTIRDNPLKSFEFVAGYFVIGTVWSFFKWDRFCAKHGQAFKEAVARFIERWNTTTENALQQFIEDEKPSEPPKRGSQHPRTIRGPWEDDKEMATQILAELKAGKIPEKLMDEWEASASGLKNTSPFYNKKKITTWIMFWPWSMANYAIFRLLADIADAIWQRLIRFYLGIRDRHFKDVDPRLIRKSRYDE